MHLNRSIEAKVLHYLGPNKVLLILGPRRVGKTHLLRKVLAQLPQEKVLKLNGEDMATEEVLKLRTIDPNAQFAVITPDNYLDWIGA